MGKQLEMFPSYVAWIQLNNLNTNKNEIQKKVVQQKAFLRKKRVKSQSKVYRSKVKK